MDASRDDREYVEREAQQIARVVLANRCAAQPWRAAGYTSATDAARVLVGECLGDEAVRARAIEIVAAEIE